MFVLLLALWVVFNGRLTWEILAIGAVISALITYFARRFLGYDPRRALAALGRLWRARTYPALILREIVKSNVALVKLVWSPRLEVKPRLVRFRTRLKSPVSRELLANSITLTPGTITASLEGDEMTVHCLDESFSEGIESCDFERLLLKAEKGGGENEHTDRV